MKTLNNDTILWAKTNPTATIPTKRAEDAGYDMYPIFPKSPSYVIAPQTTELIPTGIALAISSKYYMQIEERGSTAKYSIKKSAGVVDSGYRNEIFIAITNVSNNNIIIAETQEAAEAASQTVQSPVIYPVGKAIAQAVIHEVPNLTPQEVSYEELLQYTSERGTGNLGSTGK